MTKEGKRKLQVEFSKLEKVNAGLHELLDKKKVWYEEQLAMVVLILSVSPKQDLNSLINSSKLFNKGKFFSNKGANHAKAVPLSRVPTNPTRDASVGYREGCI